MQRLSVPPLQPVSLNEFGSEGFLVRKHSTEHRDSRSRKSGHGKNIISRLLPAVAKMRAALRAAG